MKRTNRIVESFDGFSRMNESKSIDPDTRKEAYNQIKFLESSLGIVFEKWENYEAGFFAVLLYDEILNRKYQLSYVVRSSEDTTNSEPYSGFEIVDDNGRYLPEYPNGYISSIEVYKLLSKDV
jgi:hypothetical protein